MAKYKSKTESSEVIDQKLKELGLGSPDPDVESDEVVPVTDEEDVEEHDEGSAPERAYANPLEEEDEDDARPAPVAVPVAAPSKLRSALFAEEIKPPKFAEVKAPSPPPDATIPPLEELQMPVYVEPQTTLRKQKAPVSPFVRKLGTTLSKKIPGAERVRIHLRNPLNGQAALIGEYGDADLANCNDLESFIFRYLKPKWGAGSYMLTGITPSGERITAGEIHMAGPASETTANPVVELLQKTLEQQDRERREQNMAAPVNPIEMLKGLQEVNRDMAQHAQPKEDNSVMAMMTMMMQMQAQQSQQTMQMLATIMQPKEDPTTKLLLQKLVEGASSGGAAMAPPPPPPPAPSPWEGLKEMVTAMAPIVATLAPLMLSKRDDTAELKELVKTTLGSMSAQTLSPRDVISLMSEMKSKGGDDGGFRQAIEQLGLLMTVTQNMKQATEPQQSGGATFWDALAAFAQNRDLGAGIAATIRSQAEARQQQALLQQKQALIREQRNALVAVKQASPGHAPIAAVPPAAPPQTPAQVVPMRRPAPAAVAPVHAASPSHAPPGETIVTPAPAAPPTALSDVPPKPAPAIPELPAMTADHLNGLITATDEAELLQKTITMLVYFNEFEDWQHVTQTLLGLTQADRRQEAVQIVHQLFSAFVQLQLLDAAVATKVIEAFARHFNTIRDKIKDFPIAGGDSNPIADALEENEEEEEGDEEEEDEEGELEEVTDDEDENGNGRKSARH